MSLSLYKSVLDFVFPKDLLRYFDLVGEVYSTSCKIWRYCEGNGMVCIYVTIKVIYYYEIC